MAEDVYQLLNGFTASLFPPRANAAANGPSSPPVKQIRPDAYCRRSLKVAAPSFFGRFAHLDVRKKLA
jgi:hypothetical protein